MIEYAQKVVTKLPLKELWNSSGILEAQNKGFIEVQALLELARAGNFQFVVAEAGKPLCWIEDNPYPFWKNEVKSRLYSKEKPRLENYPGKYFYFAYEWKLANGKKVVVLEKNH